MSALPPTPPRPAPPPGGAPVADLRCLEGVQALAVMMLRDWFTGPEGRVRIANTFSVALGAQAAQSALQAWEAYTALIETGTRRPVRRHDLHCRCVGSDEAVLEQTLSLAARGEREEAMLVLSLLVPGDRLLPAVHTLEQAGRALVRLGARLERTSPDDLAPDRGSLH